MSERSTLQTHKTAMPSVTPAQGVSLQRACACGQQTGDEECTASKGKRLGTLQRAAVNSRTVGTVPPSVHDVLNSPGQPPDAATHSFMSSRFGHDFSQVRIHTDARAAESARAVNALAYTVGNNMVFGAGQFRPDSTAGKRLLAHELTHTIQQSDRIGLALANSSISEPGDTSKREADRVAERVIQNNIGSALTFLSSLTSAISGIAQPSHLQIQRKVSSDIEKISSDLSLGILDWAVTEAEVHEVLGLLKKDGKIIQWPADENLESSDGTKESERHWFVKEAIPVSPTKEEKTTTNKRAKNKGTKSR